MILRRVIAHFRKQEWTAIAIDFLIVVLGVFVGLQVNDWNEARKNRKDEHFFLARLHEDLSSAEARSSRLLQRRIDKRDALVSATQTLLGKSGRETLSEEECDAIGTSHIFRFAVAELPALTELQGAGRLSIIQDDRTRGALIGLRQAQYLLRDAMDESDWAVPLGDQFPDLLAVDATLVDERVSMRLKSVCDVAAMRASRTFLNVLSGNAARYDAYVRFYLEPWAAQFETARKLVDAAAAGEP